MIDEDRYWVSRIRLGAQILFWSVLVSVLLTNLSAAGIAVFGGTRAHLRWVAFVPAVAGFALLIGIWLVSLPAPRVERHDSWGARVRLLRAVAGLGAVARCVILVLKHTERTRAAPYVWLGVGLVESVSVFLLFMHVRGLSVRFGEGKLGRLSGLTAWISSIGILLITLNTRRLVQELGLSSTMRLVFSAIPLLLGVVAWVLVLQVLWRFGRRIAGAADGKCSNCGYSREGLTDIRCPECGRMCAVGCV